LVDILISWIGLDISLFSCLVALSERR